MFYLKYRPHTIAEIDNETPRDVIFSLLKAKQLPHAFLFIGNKGTGKTSTARIFAKSINCLNNAYTGKGTSIEPCNTCAHCKAIDRSTFPDVNEMDAASNRGINEIKELIRESSLLPLSGKYRVYIIDEAHMITGDGFNALLKTLEEPPETVIFILATTNLEKVPKTIVSRCVLVQFGSAKKTEIVHMLKRIALAEKITVDEKVFELIADHSDLSFRDAAKLFEELVLSKKTDLASASLIIGIHSKDLLYKAIKTRNVPSSLEWVNKYSKTSGSFKTLLEELLMDLQNHLLFLNKIPGTNTLLSFSLKETVLLMKLINEAYGQLRNSPIQSIPLEVALIEYYDTMKAVTN